MVMQLNTNDPSNPVGMSNSVDNNALLSQVLAGQDAPSTQAGFRQGSQLADQFSSQFKNFVGRAPTGDELTQFYHQFIVPQFQNGGMAQTLQNPTQGIQSFLGNNFQQQAQDTATQKLTDQQGQANSLAELFRSQGNSAISSTESSLLDYQSKLFDRLRPNLITSLKSQGLLDTGGMNEAMAGVQGDLANNASQYISQLKLQNEQGANAIAFGGASAPYSFAQQNAMNQPGMLNEAGGWGNTGMQNTFMSNLNYAQQLGLMNAQSNAQRSAQPSFMRTFGQSAATSLGSNFNIPSYISAARGSPQSTVPGAK